MEAEEGAMLYRTYRYSQWDGTQRIFEFDADQLMDLLSEDILNHGDVMQALRDMLRQGLQDRDGQQMPGLRELMEQLKNQRRQQMQQHNMDSVVDDLKERLEEIVQTERDGIKRRLDEAREQVEAQADLLVRQPSGHRVGLVAAKEGGDRERQAERANRQHQHHFPLGEVDH